MQRTRRHDGISKGSVKNYQGMTDPNGALMSIFSFPISVPIELYYSFFRTSLTLVSGRYGCTFKMPEEMRNLHTQR